MTEKKQTQQSVAIEMPKDPEGPFEYLMARQKLSGHSLVVFFIAAIAISFTLYQLFCGHFTMPRPQAHRATHLNLALILTFLIYPLGRKSWREPLTWHFLIDLLLIGLVIFIEFFIVWDLEAFISKEGAIETKDKIVCMTYIALILEGTRRGVGWSLVLVTLGLIFYCRFAEYFPGVLNGPNTHWAWFTEVQMIHAYGIFSIPIAVVAAYVALFIIFAVFLLETGAGKFFLDMAIATMGWQAGGPAKAAVVASSSFGSISGSVVANVVGTGSVTIPLMKSIGYPKHVAGAVEAVASTGGQLMPPVMGAAAFVMAEFMGIPYIKVATAAVIPAILYYTSLFTQVHLMAKKMGMVGLPKSQLPKIKPIIKSGVHLVVPMVIIVWILAKGMTPMKAGFWGLVSIFLLSFVKKIAGPPPINS